MVNSWRIYKKYSSMVQKRSNPIQITCKNWQTACCTCNLTLGVTVILKNTGTLQILNMYFLTSIHSWAEGLAFGPNFRIGWDTLCFKILLMWTSNGSFSNWNKSFQKQTRQYIYTCLCDTFKLMWRQNHNLLKNWMQFSKSSLQMVQHNSVMCVQHLASPRSQCRVSSLRKNQIFR